MTEKPVRSVPTARRTPQQLRFSKVYDAYKHSYILTLLSSLGPLHIVLADAPSPRGSDTTLAGMGTLSEGFERFVAAPLQPRRLRAMVRTSDSVLLSSFRQSFQQLSGRKRVNLTLPIREGLPTILPESIHPHQPAQSIIARTHGSNLWQKIGPSRAHTRENDA